LKKGLVPFWVALLPVTKNGLEHVVLSLTLICHGLFRGTMELWDTMFDYRQIPLGGIHSLLARAVAKPAPTQAGEPISPRMDAGPTKYGA